MFSEGNDASWRGGAIDPYTDGVAIVLGGARVEPRAGLASEVGPEHLRLGPATPSEDADGLPLRHGRPFWRRCRAAEPAIHAVRGARWSSTPARPNAVGRDRT